MYEKEQLRQIFQQRFNAATWNNMLRNIIKADELRITPETITEPADCDRGYYLGAKNTTDSYHIGLFLYEVQNSSVAHKRVGLRNLVKTFINPRWGQFDAALAVFTDGNQWRLSFISDIRGESTSPKRYTFVFGEHGNLYRTAIERFLMLQDKGVTFETLKEAFSVEALTKQFYNDLFEWYQWAVSPESNVTFPNDTTTEDDDRENIDTKIIRLITRIMFVWFIKQKELVPSEIFNENHLKGILKDFDSQSETDGNYYNAILQNLFFATLNRAIEDEQGNKRRFSTLKGHRDIKNLYRYAELFSISKDEVIKMFSSVPFLNGGLFECQDKTVRLNGVEKAYNYDGFSRNDARFADGRYKYRAVIPNSLFFKPEYGLFDILNRYNFTIEENSPNEQQVALDPELLGKVFENLLGAYNPETKETARNQSGSFYTPREIVNYMVDESLKAYLGDTEIVNALLCEDFHKDETLTDEYNALAEKIKAIKILDPACGSGAFPMGLLNRMVNILQKISPEENVYNLKLSIIENCIYGSDIQSIAAQISKLRFFISLICDCIPDKSKPNFGIPTLPNLETKFVCANSLIGLKKENTSNTFDFDDSDVIKAKKAELQEVRHLHFNARTANQKATLREKDERLRKELAALLEEDQFCPTEESRLLVAWNPYDQNACSPFFDPEWMFGVQKFDIVIGNPPYISTKGVKAEDKKAYEAEFGFSDDTYNLFTFKGLQLTKDGGTLNYIIPKTFWTTQTKRNMRDLILNRKINYIFDTADPFESAMVDTCVIQIQNSKAKTDHLVEFRDGSEDLHNPIVYAPIPQKIYCNTQNSVIFKPTEHNLRIYELYGEKVKVLYDKWWDKIKTSRDIEKNRAELERYRASLKPGDVALLGCLTEGGQGLATANNGKYIAVRKSTKWAANIIESRPKKLAEAFKKVKRFAVDGLDSPDYAKDFLAAMTENEIADLFDSLKDKYGRDIFGQGYIYKLIDDNELADIDSLTSDEKENGIDTSKNYYVPYDKGDKDGNRWYLETPFAIAWSRENVQFLKTDPKARYQGYTFYFREGFSWTDINSTYLKARLKTNGIFDVVSMSLFTKVSLPDWFYVCLINTSFISCYVDDFINNTSHFQINDARQLPIIIPTDEQLSRFKDIFNNAVRLKKASNSFDELEALEKQLDQMIMQLYGI